MSDDIKIVDGTDYTDKDGEKKHPSFSQDLLDGIDDIEVEELEDQPKEKPTQKEIPTEEPEEAVDDEEEIVDDEEKISGDEEDKNKEEPEEVELDESYFKELKDITSELRQAHSSVEMASRITNAVKRPDKPTVLEEDDPESWAQYRSDVSAYNQALNTYKIQAEIAKGNVEKIAGKQETVFREAHEGEDLKGFESFMASNVAYQSLFFTGAETLEDLYAIYKMKSGEVTVKKQISDLKKKGQKFKAVNINGSGKEISTKGKYPDKYQYLNKPELKDMRDMLLKEKNPFTGVKPSLKEVNELLKSEYNYRKGKF